MTAPVGSTSWRVYLLSTLEFDVGTPVRLYGAFQAASTQAASELTFVLDNELPWDPHLLPSDQVTKQVDAPWGMTGVRLEDFQVAARLLRGRDGETEVTMELQAVARFTSPTLSSYVLDGALVLDQPAGETTIEPRLALVRLGTRGPALTLMQLVESVVGAEWGWADEVTSDFALLSGSLYYLRPPHSAGPGYEYIYTAPGLPSLVCQPGYRADAVLRIFGEYDFKVSLAVVPQSQRNVVTLTGTLLETLNFDFVQLVHPGIQLSTGPGGKSLVVQSGVTVFGTELQLSAGYRTAPTPAGTGGFVGEVTTEVDGTMVGVEVTWTQGSFHITQIIGLPTPDLDLTEELLSAFNADAKCGKIVSDWLSRLTQTSFGLKLAGMPKKVDAGTMSVPLKATYNLKVAGSTIASDELPFDAIFEIPKGLSALPAAIASSVAESAASFAQAMLANPATYQVIALQAAKQGGTSALTRFICRAQEEGTQEEGSQESGSQELAEQLAATAGPIVAEALVGAVVAAELPELGALIAAVAAVAVLSAVAAVAMDGRSGDHSGKPQAEDRIRTAGSWIAAVMQALLDKADEVTALVRIPSLPVEISADGEFTAAWARPSVDQGLAVSFQFTLLQGPAGTPTRAAWPGFDTLALPAGTTSYAIPLSRISRVTEFGMNASVVATATGLNLLSPATRTSLQDAIDKLGGMDSDAARQVAAQLQGQLDRLVQVDDNGVVGAPVYATYQAPATVTVGQSRVGLTMRLGRQP